jgi:hypothetical protein
MDYNDTPLDRLISRIKPVKLSVDGNKDVNILNGRLQIPGAGLRLIATEVGIETENWKVYLTTIHMN